MTKKTVIGMATITFLALVGTPVMAQAPRTWVSGVGDDANPCSRTAPCKTFAGAISKTAAGGEINCLDPAGFGAVTITKAITIDCTGTLGGILNSVTNGVIVNAAATDVVALRGLDINGGASLGTNGIRFLGGAALHVEDSVIHNQSGYGVDFEPNAASANARLSIRNTNIRKCSGASGGGVLVKPTAPNLASVQLEHVAIDGNTVGLRAEAGAKVVATNTSSVENANTGFNAVTSTTAVEITLDRTTIASNGIGNASADAGGVRSSGGTAIIRLDNCVITNNKTGVLGAAGGSVLSMGNNLIQGNTVDLGIALGSITPQ